jgi:hypothetical protein
MGRRTVRRRGWTFPCSIYAEGTRSLLAPECPFLPLAVQPPLALSTLYCSPCFFSSVNLYMCARLAVML